MHFVNNFLTVDHAVMFYETVFVLKAVNFSTRQGRNYWELFWNHFVFHLTTAATFIVTDISPVDLSVY